MCLQAEKAPGHLMALILPWLVAAAARWQPLQCLGDELSFPHSLPEFLLALEQRRKTGRVDRLYISFFNALGKWKRTMYISFCQKFLSTVLNSLCRRQFSLQEHYKIVLNFPCIVKKLENSFTPLILHPKRPRIFPPMALYWLSKKMS